MSNGKSLLDYKDSLLSGIWTVWSNLLFDVSFVKIKCWIIDLESLRSVVNRTRMIKAKNRFELRFELRLMVTVKLLFDPNCMFLISCATCIVSTYTEIWELMLLKIRPFCHQIVDDPGPLNSPAGLGQLKFNVALITLRCPCHEAASNFWLQFLHRIWFFRKWILFNLG